MLGKILPKKRIGIIPVETAGYVAGLESGLHKLGYDVRAVTIGLHEFEYGQLKINPVWARWTQKVSTMQNTGKSASFLALWIINLALRVWGTLWVTMSFDVLVLNNGRSLLPLHLDLLLYRARGIRIVAMMGHGSEIRPACIDSLGSGGRMFSSEENQTLKRECFAKRRFVRRVEALSHIVISTPTLSHYLRKPYINGHLLGIPIPKQVILQKGGRDRDQKRTKLLPKVVHIPSQPVVKGTDMIVEICTTLEREGLIEFEFRTGLTHFEAIELLATSDILVDQAYSDVWMPVLATEAAFLGVPAIVAGYAWEFLDKTTSRRAKPPVINVPPDEIESSLRELLGNTARLKELGQQARDFVHDQRTDEAVAKKYLPIFAFSEDQFRELLEPLASPNYRWGCGSSKRAIKALSLAGKPHRSFD